MKDDLGWGKNEIIELKFSNLNIEIFEIIFTKYCHKSEIFEKSKGFTRANLFANVLDLIFTKTL